MTRWEPLRSHVSYAVDEANRMEIAEPTSQLMGYLGTLLSAKALHRDAERLKRLVLSIDERTYGSDSAIVATRLNNLATTLQATNRLSEAEPLMRRALAVAIDFKKSTGHEHSRYEDRLQRYTYLLREMNVDEADIQKRIADLFK